MGQQVSHPPIPQLPTNVATLLADVRTANSIASRVSKDGECLWFHVADAAHIEVFNSVRLVASIVVTKIPCYKGDGDASSSQPPQQASQQQQQQPAAAAGGAEGGVVGNGAVRNDGAAVGGGEAHASSHLHSAVVGATTTTTTSLPSPARPRKFWKVLTLPNFYAAYRMLQQQQTVTPAPEGDDFEEEFARSKRNSSNDGDVDSSDDRKRDSFTTSTSGAHAASKAIDIKRKSNDSRGSVGGSLGTLGTGGGGGGGGGLLSSSLDAVQSRRKSKSDEIDQEEGECPICFEQIKNGLSLPCMHGPFCGSCISQWNVTHRSCPVCRRAVTADSVDCWVHLDAPSSNDMVDALYSFIAKLD